MAVLCSNSRSSLFALKIPKNRQSPIVSEIGSQPRFFEANGCPLKTHQHLLVSRPVEEYKAFPNRYIRRQQQFRMTAESPNSYALSRQPARLDRTALSEEESEPEEGENHHFVEAPHVARRPSLGPPQRAPLPTEVSSIGNHEAFAGYQRETPVLVTPPTIPAPSSYSAALEDQAHSGHWIRRSPAMEDLLAVDEHNISVLHDAFPMDSLHIGLRIVAAKPNVGLGAVHSYGDADELRLLHRATNRGFPLGSLQ